MTALLITSSVLILTLTALRYLLRGRVDPRLQYALWLLVALRLLIPVGLPSSPVSVLNAVPPAVQALRPAAAAAAQPDTALPAPDVVLPPQGAHPPVTAPQTPAAPDLATLLPLLWLAGAVGLGLWFLGANLAFHRALRRSARRVEVDHFPLPVYVTGAVPSPCLFGLLRPAVYLTPDCLEDRVRLWHILTHERTHYRQGDHLWSALRCLLLCLYWFDPLVWLAGALSRRDCELSCDAGALSALGEGERTAYGRTLLSMVAPRRAPGDLFRAATTMTSGKESLTERVKLIAKRPKMLAVTLAAVVVIAAVVAACTFTGAGQPSLEVQLMSPPEALAVVTTKENTNGIFYSYHYEEDYNTGLGGRLFQVGVLTQAEFEQSYQTWENTGGVTCLGRDDQWYYVLIGTTDVQYNPEHQAEYMATLQALRDWTDQVFAARKGVTPMEEDPLYQSFRSDTFFPGNHINAAYHPYRGTAETMDPVRPLLLSQPVKQGDGGIWCVDRWYDENGNSYYAVPETDVTMAEYYAGLQAQADSGTRPDLLDPAAVSLAFVRSYLGHDHATTESFEMGERYQGAPTADPGQDNAPEVGRLLEELAQSGQVGLSLTVEFGPTGEYEGGVTYYKQVAELQQGNGANYLSALTSDVIWSPSAPPPEPGAVLPPTEPTPTELTLWGGEGMASSFTVYFGSPYVRYQEGETVTWYQVIPKADDVFYPEIFALLRAWYDETERAAAWPVLETEGADAGEVARLWGEAMAQSMQESISPGSAYEVLDAALLSAEVLERDMDREVPRIIAAITLVYRLEDPNAPVWMAGAGVEEVTQGPYTGWYAHAREYALEYREGAWRVAETATGGLRLD